MLYGLVVSLFVFVCIILILVIMVQQGKGGGIGFGGMGGGSQMLFGGSGGQDLFQKITWVLGTIFIFGSLGLTTWKAYDSKTSLYLRRPAYQYPTRHASEPTPVTQPESN